MEADEAEDEDDIDFLNLSMPDLSFDGTYVRQWVRCIRPYIRHEIFRTYVLRKYKSLNFAKKNKKFHKFFWQQFIYQSDCSVSGNCVFVAIEVFCYAAQLERLYKLYVKVVNIWH